MSTERVIEILRNTTALMKENFPDTPVYVTLGNHDYYPASQMPGENNAVFTAAAEMWSDWIDTADAQQTFKRGMIHKFLFPCFGTLLLTLQQNCCSWPSTAMEYHW